MHHQQRQRQHHAHDPVERLFVELVAGHGGLGDLQTHGAFGQEGHFVDQDLDDRAKGQGHHGQIRTRHTQSGQGQDRTKNACDHNAGRHDDPERRADLEEQHTCGVGTDAEQTGVAQRDLAGVTDHDVQAEQQDRVDHDGLDQVDVVRVLCEHRHQEQGDEAQHGSNEIFAIHHQTFLIADLPNKPAGLTASTSKRRTRPGTSL